MKVQFLRVTNEEDIDNFFIDVKRQLVKNADPTLVQVELKREYAPAAMGQWAGIITTIIMNFPQCIHATIMLWDIFAKKLQDFSTKNESPRIGDQFTLENLCRRHLLHQGISEFNLISFRWTVDEAYLDNRKEVTYDEDIASKQRIAEFVFKDSEFEYDYLIDNDGEITSFRKLNQRG